MDRKKREITANYIQSNFIEELNIFIGFYPPILISQKAVLYAHIYIICTFPLLLRERKLSLFFFC